MVWPLTIWSAAREASVTPTWAHEPFWPVATPHYWGVVRGVNFTPPHTMYLRLKTQRKVSHSYGTHRALAFSCLLQRNAKWRMPGATMELGSQSVTVTEPHHRDWFLSSGHAQGPGQEWCETQMSWGGPPANDKKVLPIKAADPLWTYHVSFLQRVEGVCL